MNENEKVKDEFVQIRIMASNKKTILNIVKKLQKIYVNSIFTGIEENKKLTEGLKWRGYLIVKLKRREKHGLD
jgi:hypothetical protein